MTTGTMTREDTGSFAPVRLAAVAQPSHGNPLTGWMPPSSWADEPTPRHDAVYADEQPVSEAHALAQIDYARSLVGYEDARHRWASERDLQTWCAQTTATWVPAVEQYRPRSVSELFYEEEYRRLRDNPQLLPAPEVLLAKLPEPPEKQLTPEALDAEHQQRQAVSPQLTAKWQPADDEPEPVGPPGPSQPPGPPEPPTPPGPPEPWRLLREEWSEFWADLRRLPSELRAWWPWRKGAK